MNHAQREELSDVKEPAVEGTPATDSAALTEAEQVAAIIAQTSADLAGRTEAAIQSELANRFKALGLDISADEARRVAHDISLAPKLRDIIDD